MISSYAKVIKQLTIKRSLTVATQKVKHTTNALSLHGNSSCKRSPTQTCLILQGNTIAQEIVIVLVGMNML